VGPAWFSRRAVLLHLTAIVVVPGCIFLGWWQVTRAISGNTLSWAYAFEWPLFACYGVYMWWKLVHEQPDPTASAEAGGASRSEPAAPADKEEEEEDEELAAYNRYLAELSAADERNRR
jgi:DNA-binding transcriptional regulator of glucitol operon